MPNIDSQPAVVEMPEVNKWVELPYIDAFYILTGSRQSGMGLGRIPLSEILYYYEHFPIGRKMDFIYIIQYTDNMYLKAYYDDPKNKPKDVKE